MGWALAVQGGAGGISPSMPPELREPRLATLRRCIDLGGAALRAGRPALDVVELVVRELENCPHFNAGRGSVLTTDGTVEMEACIMEGHTLRCGAVAGVSTVVNPVSLARVVMEKTPHIFLAFDGAEAFAREQGLETMEPSHFITDASIERLRQEKEANKVQVILRATYWSRLWSLKVREGNRPMVKKACSQIESTAMEVFMNNGWRFIHKISF
ncbi:hypothetical protein ACP70R_045665 [Stipagrostis hirtigluma subsp. patula]